MSDISKLTDELLNHAGFKIKKPSQIRLHIENKIASNIEDEGEDFAIDQFCFENVFLGLEGSLNTEPEIDEEQSIYTFTSQICGYLTIDSNPFFLNMDEEEWIRVNTEFKNGGLEIVLWDNTSKHNGFLISPTLFTSIDKFQLCLNDFRDIKLNNLQETPEEEERYKAIFNRFVNDYPIVINSFYTDFKKLGDVKISNQYTIPDAVKNTVTCAKYFTELAFNGSSEIAVDLETFSEASGDFDSANSCHAILKLFSLHHLGKDIEANAYAKEVLSRKELSVQAHKWATRYTEGHNFFSKIESL